MPHYIVLPASFIVDDNLGSGRNGFANTGQNQHIVPLDAFVIGRISELECEHAKIGEVLPVDACERNGQHRA